MQQISSPGIVLRTIEHGDHDKIVTVYTSNHGKRSFIAKGAKKSTKRFGGALEPFTLLNLVWVSRQANGLPFLQEVSIIHPFDKIRSLYQHMVYASYWCELVYRWMEEGKKQTDTYALLAFALEQLNAQGVSAQTLHLVFQLRFMAIHGFKPHLEQCLACQTLLDDFHEPLVFFDVKRGGALCKNCRPQGISGSSLSRGTVKQLLWILNTPLSKLHRMRFSQQALGESLTLLEAFILHHLGQETKSMKLVKQLSSRQPQAKKPPPLP